MVVGLEHLREHFNGHEECFILIGGAACDLWMGDNGLRFRATEDLDVVLIFDEVDPLFAKAFWSFIHEGQYATHQQSEERPTFYRFSEPRHPNHPRQMELLSRNQLELPETARLTPIPVEDDISSLSAILLDDDYYDYIFNSRIRIDGIPTVPAECLIPLKAKAHLDLSARRADGDTKVRGTDIRKHRNDVFLLYQTLTPDDRFDLPKALRTDLLEFLSRLPPASNDWQAIRQSVQNILGGDYPVEPAHVIAQMNEIFQL